MIGKENTKPNIWRRILVAVLRLFTRRAWELKYRSEIKRELKRKSKNELIRMILELRKQVAVDGQKERKKALKQMNKNHSERMKALTQYSKGDRKGRAGNE